MNSVRKRYLRGIYQVWKEGKLEKRVSLSKQDMRYLQNMKNKELHKLYEQGNNNEATNENQ